MILSTSPSPTVGSRQRFPLSRITGEGKSVSLRGLQKKQHGVALIVAVLLVAIAAVLATALVDRLNLDIRRTENLIHSEQAYVYAQGAEVIAIAALVEDKKNTKYDSLDEDWATETPPFPVEGGAIVGTLIDLQGCFNINNLSNTLNATNFSEDQARFGRLLSALDLPPGISQAVVDWLDEDMETTTGGAEDDWYIGLTPPYRAANGPITSVSELRMVKGLEQVDKDKPFDKLVPSTATKTPLVCTLPIATAINVNTAPKEVLKSLAADLTDEDADKIIEHRLGGADSQTAKAVPFETLEQFKSFMSTALNKPNFDTSKMMSVSSNYFLLEATAQIGNNRAHLYSIIYRDENGGCRVIARSQGVW